MPTATRLLPLAWRRRAAGRPAVPTQPARKKCLFASPVGRDAKENLHKIIERFGHDAFDFLLLVYDDSRYEEDCFAGCTVVYDRAPLFWQLQRCLTPELCRRYEYVFLWMDDLDVMKFNPQHFLHILRRYHLEVAQPALSSDSVISHPITARRPAEIGRYTDFVEEMAFVFRGDLWERFWRLIEPDRNPWGWGYDEVAYSVCGFRRLAIVDCEAIRHLRKGSYHAAAGADQSKTHRRYRRFYFPRKRTLCSISDRFLHRCLLAPFLLNLYFICTKLYTFLRLGYVRLLLRACLHPTTATVPGKSL